MELEEGPSICGHQVNSKSPISILHKAIEWMLELFKECGHRSFEVF